MYLFVDSLGNFRISEYRPKKFSIRKPLFHHSEEEEDYHGRTSLNYYYIPSKSQVIEYWSYYPIREPLEWYNNRPSLGKPYISDIGIVIPSKLLKEKYLNLTFNDEPILIE